MSLSYIGQQIIIYAGTPLIITGLIGNSINIVAFSTNRNYRTTPCTFYFLLSAIVNFIYISTNFIPRVVSQTSGYNLLNVSSAWCKMRYFCVITFALMTLSSSSLATIDQYFVTSQNVRIRRFSNIKRAHRIGLIMMIICILHGIIPLVSFDVSPVTKTCVATSFTYSIYNIIYLLGWITTVPSSIMIIFGYLTYRNIHQTIVLQQQQADRQLVRMLFIQVALDLICIVPYGLLSAYMSITSRTQKDANRQIIENFILTVLTVLTYFYYSISCYMFLMTSSRFRRATKDRILFCFRANQIIPLQFRPTRQTTQHRTGNIS